MTRTAPSIMILALLLAAPALGAPADGGVYNVGDLEVTAGDLSRPDVAGSGRAAAGEAKLPAGARREARLVDLGAGGLSAGAKRGATDAFVTFGTYATVKAGAAWSWSDELSGDNRARVDYFSTDGHRFRSDARRAAVAFDSGNRPAGDGRLDLHGELRDGRERMPGAIDAPTRLLERTTRGYTARADYAPSAAGLSATLEFSGDALEGESLPLLLDDSASTGTARVRAEWRPGVTGDFAVGLDAASHSLDVDGAADVRSTDAGLAARYRFEAGGSLVSAEAGVRKAGDRDAEGEGDLTLRHKLDPRTSARLSLGARTDAYAYADLLLRGPGYANLRDAAGGNRFAGLDRPARRARYVEAGLRRELGTGWIDLELTSEKIDGEWVYVPLNAADSRVDAVAATDGAALRVAKASFVRPLDERRRLVLSALSRKAEEARGDLPFRPRSECRAAFEFSGARTRGELSVAALGAQAVDFTGGRVEGHVEVGLSLAHDVADGLAAEIQAENLLDRAHDLRPGFPARGRLVSGGLRYRF